MPRAAQAPLALGEAVLAGGPDLLVEKAGIIETLQTFIVLRKAELYVPLLEDTKHTALLYVEDAQALLEYAEKMGSELAVAKVGKTFFAPPPPLA